MASRLFEPEPADTDHRAYSNLRSASFRPDIREWCDDVYSRAAPFLDDDFCDRFRRETPHRVSELFFAEAFLNAGWEPIDRVKGFDLAFRLGEGRLLVEITTPDPPKSDTWETEEKDGIELWSADESSEDAALRRLTSGFASKADRIRKLVSDGSVTDSDYIVIALSGFRLSQETPTAPENGGDVPAFAKAFLPIGSRYVTFHMGEGADDRPSDGGYLYKATIEQSGKTPVDRNAFLRPDFEHIDAVAYTPLHMGGPGDGPPDPVAQCAVLHNPMARRGEDPVKLRMGEEYFVAVEGDQFSVARF